MIIHLGDVLVTLKVLEIFLSLYKFANDNYLLDHIDSYKNLR